MASISTDKDGARGRRALDHHIPLIPFIDFLLCLVAFLLVTAVWSQMARLESSALVPGKETHDPQPPSKQLHVRLAGEKFQLEWRQGNTVLESHEVRKTPVISDGQTRFPALEQRVAEAWSQGGVHRALTDPERDQAVVHAPNSLAFEELAAILDALHGPTRPFAERRMPALAVSFAVN